MRAYKAECSACFTNFLNVLFGFSLKNINQVTQNAAGIDLIDDANKLVLQVSSTASKAKVESALSKDPLCSCV